MWILCTHFSLKRSVHQRGRGKRATFGHDRFFPERREDKRERRFMTGKKRREQKQAGVSAEDECLQSVFSVCIFPSDFQRGR